MHNRFYQMHIHPEYGYGCYVMRHDEVESAKPGYNEIHFRPVFLNRTEGSTELAYTKKPIRFPTAEREAVLGYLDAKYKTSEETVKDNKDAFKHLRKLCQATGATVDCGFSDDGWPVLKDRKSGFVGFSVRHRCFNSTFRVPIPPSYVDKRVPEYVLRNQLGSDLRGWLWNSMHISPLCDQIAAAKLLLALKCQARKPVRPKPAAKKKQSRL